MEVRYRNKRRTSRYLNTAHRRGPEPTATEDLGQEIVVFCGHPTEEGVCYGARLVLASCIDHTRLARPIISTQPRRKKPGGALDTGRGNATIATRVCASVADGIRDGSRGPLCRRRPGLREPLLVVTDGKPGLIKPFRGGPGRLLRGRVALSTGSATCLCERRGKREDAGHRSLAERERSLFVSEPLS